MEERFVLDGRGLAVNCYGRDRIVQRVQLARLRLQPLQALGAVLPLAVRFLLRRHERRRLGIHEGVHRTKSRELITRTFISPRPRQDLWHFELLLRNDLL